MAKYDLRLKAREMRAHGESVKAIAKKLNIAKSTSSIWVRDIVMSVEQLSVLRKNSLKGKEIGRLKGALKQKNDRLDKIKMYSVEGVKQLMTTSQNEFFVSGVALYWAEGSKKSGRLQFCNSDPNLILFMIKWLKVFFDIDINRLSLRVGINQIHQERESDVIRYWSNITSVPINQFRKTSFKTAKSSKVYDNFETHFGTLDVCVLKPGDLYYKILGLIDGLANVAQR